MIHEFFTRLRFLLARRKLTELDEELTFHIEQSTNASSLQGFPRKRPVARRSSNSAASNEPASNLTGNVRIDSSAPSCKTSVTQFVASAAARSLPPP